MFQINSVLSVNFLFIKGLMISNGQSMAICALNYFVGFLIINLVI